MSKKKIIQNFYYKTLEIFQPSYHLQTYQKRNMGLKNLILTYKLKNVVIDILKEILKILFIISNLNVC